MYLGFEINTLHYFSILCTVSVYIWHLNFLALNLCTKKLGKKYGKTLFLYCKRIVAIIYKCVNSNPSTSNVKFLKYMPAAPFERKLVQCGGICALPKMQNDNLIAYTKFFPYRLLVIYRFLLIFGRYFLKLNFIFFKYFVIFFPASGLQLMFLEILLVPVWCTI